MQAVSENNSLSHRSSANSRMPADEIPSVVKTESVTCPICKTNASKKLLQVNDLVCNLAGQYSLVECASCGLKRTDPRPTAETIGYYYPDSYAPYLSSGIMSTQTGSSASFLKKMVHLRGNDVPHMPAGNLLEIGCGSGNFLFQMKKMGWTVEGIEFSASAAASCRVAGLNVQNTTVDGASLAPRSFDMVVGWMVLEHLHEPRDMLIKLREKAKDDGWLVVSVPDIANIFARLFGKYWCALHMPAHLFHYTPKTLGLMMKESGWKIDRIIWHDSSTCLINSVTNVLRYAFGFEKAARSFETFIKKRPGRLLSYALGFCLGRTRQSGKITVWARKA